MAQVNIYKIAESRINDLMDYLEEKYERRGNRTVLFDRVNQAGERTEVEYQVTLFYTLSEDTKSLKWNWVFELFEQADVRVSDSPRAVVILSQNDSANVYAMTFGYSYFKVDQYSDKSWPFQFARRLRYSNVETTSFTNPNSQRNKTVNTYIDYRDLDFDSGEALTKLKAKVVLPEGFDLFDERLEFGHSIKFSCPEPNLERIVEFIEHVDHVIATQDELVRIPYFHPLKDPNEIGRLYGLLKERIKSGAFSVDFSEYQIFATKIIFSQHYEFEYRYNRRTMKCDSVNQETLMAFIRKYNISMDNFLDIKVVVSEDGVSKFTTTIFKLLFYTDETEKVLLTDGNWYLYNDDYLDYLHDSLSEIPVYYNREYDYSAQQHKEFLDAKFLEERDAAEYAGLSDTEIRKKIEKKYYREKYFNINLTEQGYLIFDRDLETIGKHKIEIMDLYKDETMFTVKLGNSSSKLCYAVDQSLEAIKAYRKRLVPRQQIIKEVCLWLVLDRGDLPMVNGRPDINALEMLILKGKIDHWKKEVRKIGFDPIIRINYCRN